MRSELRDALLGAMVAIDIDLDITDKQVKLPLGAPIPTDYLEQSLEHVSGKILQRLTTRLISSMWLLAKHPEPATAIKALAMPVCHPLHPGGVWQAQRLLGEALDLGMGVVKDNGTTVRAIPLWVLRWAHIDDVEAEINSRALLGKYGRLAVERAKKRQEPNLLRPMGAADCVTLLASADVRAHLVSADPTKMVAVAAPHRREAWSMLDADLKFVRVLAHTEWSERGFREPLLVTRDEVKMAIGAPQL